MVEEVPAPINPDSPVEDFWRWCPGWGAIVERLRRHGRLMMEEGDAGGVSECYLYLQLCLQPYLILGCTDTSCNQA
jgi:hypothetical protein